MGVVAPLRSFDPDAGAQHGAIGIDREAREAAALDPQPATERCQGSLASLPARTRLRATRWAIPEHLIGSAMALNLARSRLTCRARRTWGHVGFAPRRGWRSTTTTLGVRRSMGRCVASMNEDTHFAYPVTSSGTESSPLGSRPWRRKPWAGAPNTTCGVSVNIHSQPAATPGSTPPSKRAWTKHGTCRSRVRSQTRPALKSSASCYSGGSPTSRTVGSPSETGSFTFELSAELSPALQEMALRRDCALQRLEPAIDRAELEGIHVQRPRK